MCAEHKKPRKLLKHLEAARAAGRAQRNQPRCLVFTNRVKTAKFVAKTLAEAGHRVGLLHGQRPQNEREVGPAGLSSRPQSQPPAARLTFGLIHAKFTYHLRCASLLNFPCTMVLGGSCRL